MAYDSANRLESIRDSLQRTTTFKYDNADRLLKRTLPNGQQVRFAYDAAGNMVSLTPAGRPAHAFTFTPVDLPDTYTPPLSGIVHFDYNRDRQLTRMTRPDGSAIALGYDGDQISRQH
jgi:YD repeat-containing protein